MEEVSIENNLQKPLLSKKEIEKIVNNSQRIEGYKPVSKEYILKVKALMKKHDMKVSL